MSSSSNIFDGLVVLQYRSGNQQALDLLVRKYHKRLCKHAYGYTYDMDAAKDIVQECWGAILSKMNTLKEPNHFGSWAFRIVTRKSLDFIKKEKRKKAHLNALSREYCSEEVPKENASELHQLKVLIQKLPKDQQLVIRLFYTEDYSLKEIAEILDISLGTVKSRLFHARERLKTAIKK